VVPALDQCLIAVTVVNPLFGVSVVVVTACGVELSGPQSTVAQNATASARTKLRVRGCQQSIEANNSIPSRRFYIAAPGQFIPEVPEIKSTYDRGWRSRKSMFHKGQNVRSSHHSNVTLWLTMHGES
jgi:hypothetical protein